MRFSKSVRHAFGEGIFFAPNAFLAHNPVVLLQNDSQVLRHQHKIFASAGVGVTNHDKAGAVVTENAVYFREDGHQIGDVLFQRLFLANLFSNAVIA